MDVKVTDFLFVIALIGFVFFSMMEVTKQGSSFHKKCKDQKGFVVSNKDKRVCIKKESVLFYE